MSGNDCWNKNVFSRWRKVAMEGDDWTWTGKVFQTIAAETGNKRRLTAVRRYDGTNSSMTTEDGDDLAGLIPERADWNTPAPCHAEHDMPSAQVWNSPVPGDVASVILRNNMHHCSDPVVLGWATPGWLNDGCYTWYLNLSHGTSSSQTERQIVAA